jgi:hypothetical protein
MERPAKVARVDGPEFQENPKPGPMAPNEWRYDEQRRTVHIGVAAAAGSDIIVNLVF